LVTQFNNITTFDPWKTNN